jgi:CRP/FNR family cyclic AMP-dependent transcriptional regulator
MDANRLKSIPLFADLSDHERGQIARWADEVQVPEGKHLADQGEFAYEFFVIEEGSAVVTRDGERLKELGAGDFFGEIALLETDRRTATVTASSPMRLIVMHGRDFREMASEMPHVAEKIRAAIRERMAAP